MEEEEGMIKEDLETNNDFSTMGERIKEAEERIRVLHRDHQVCARVSVRGCTRVFAWLCLGASRRVCLCLSAVGMGVIEFVYRVTFSHREQPHIISRSQP